MLGGVKRIGSGLVTTTAIDTVPAGQFDAVQCDRWGAGCLWWRSGALIKGIGAAAEVATKTLGRTTNVGGRTATNGADGVARLYTTKEAAESILAEGAIKPVPASGKVWLTPDKYCQRCGGSGQAGAQ